jgi:DNA-binding NarL/FixJ family response regulator
VSGRTRTRAPSTQGPIRIVLIEDNRLARDQLVALLERQANVKVVATASCPTTGLAHVQETKPQIVLVGAGLGNNDSHLCLKSVKNMAPAARVILMDVLPVREDIVAFVKAGANGFILKDATGDDVVATIRSVAQGTDAIPAPLASMLLSYIADQALVGTAPGGLPTTVRITKREREITQLIAEGLANKEIAQRLRIATYTVKSHVHNILEKLALHTRLQLAAHTHWVGAPIGDDQGALKVRPRDPWGGPWSACGSPRSQARCPAV